MTIEILPQERKQVLAIAVKDTLTESDYDQLRPEMDLRAEQFDSFDLLIDISDLGTPEPAAIRSELEFTKDYTNQIGHMALVSDHAIWDGLTQYVGKPLGAVLGVELEHFEDRAVATEWLASEQQS